MKVTVSTAAGSMPKRTMLPLLIILFLISYGLLTMLVVQQDRKIDSQRSLIHLLFKDNVHLSALRGGQNRLGYAADTGASHDRSLAAQSAPAQSSHATSSQAPLANQIPLIQVPAGANQVTSNQVPESQARMQTNAKGAKTRKAQKQRPVPPVEITDPSDTRRVSFSI